MTVEGRLSLGSSYGGESLNIYHDRTDRGRDLESAKGSFQSMVNHIKKGEGR
jgi:hypothetical protein